MKTHKLRAKQFYNIGPGTQCYKTFYGRSSRNMLECLSLASLSNLVQCLQVRLGPTQMKCLFRYSTLGQAPGLAHKHQTRLERLVRDKRSSLLRKHVTYGRKVLQQWSQKSSQYDIKNYRPKKGLNLSFFWGLYNQT